jgi:hypothetical protein
MAGLTYGFTALGNQTGTTLPASFLKVPGLPDSPYYSYAGGITLTVLVLFGIGVLVTRAEPALNVLGRTVEQLSGGAFTRNLLVWSVAVGVGVGMVIGAVKILFNVQIIYFILSKYAVAVVLTYFSDEAITVRGGNLAGWLASRPCML